MKTLVKKKLTIAGALPLLPETEGVVQSNQHMGAFGPSKVFPLTPEALWWVNIWLTGIQGCRGSTKWLERCVGQGRRLGDARKPK